MAGQADIPTVEPYGVPEPGRSQRILPLAYVIWTLVGALVGLGLLSILTIGLQVLAVALVVTIIGVAVPGFRNQSVVAAVSGLGLPVLYVAWLNRGGPGTVCKVQATSTSCMDEWSPWPFVAVALILIATGVLLVRVTRRSRSVAP